MGDSSWGYARETLRMTAGLLVWAAHLAIVYGIVAMACARGHAASVTVAWVGAVTVASLLATSVILVTAVRQLGRGGDSRRFLDAVTAMVAGFSLIAIAWDGLPALFVPACPG